ncbi:hypothetical protein [Endozoicomonas sp. Mp262]|uniref:hypothetical protein n=1 Tax=Endozoicomonas sp. Mp262 TaxID=2919499 RepID=UPI0021D9BD4A
MIVLSLFLRIDKIFEKGFYDESCKEFSEALNTEINKVFFGELEMSSFRKELECYGYSMNWLQMLCSYAYYSELAVYHFLKAYLIRFLGSRGVSIDPFFLENFQLITEMFHPDQKKRPSAKKLLQEVKWQ